MLDIYLPTFRRWKSTTPETRITEFGYPNGDPVLCFHGFPDCKSIFIENEGHFSLAGKYLKTLWEELKVKDL